MSDDHSHDHDAHGDHDADAGGRGPSTSAVAIPLVALGLLGAAIWLGSQRGAVPVPEGGVPGVVATVADPLPSWNDGPTKRAILEFVTAVTDESASTFVPVAERVAVFDHDGTLVCEKPVIHGLFLVDRVKALVERRPELAHEEPYATIMTGDIEFIRKLGKKIFAELTFATIAGVSEEELERDARAFVRSARHPVFDAALGDVTFLPMKELMALLRAKGFSVWICSGSGVHFMRPVAEAWYGIGPEHVIASRPVSEMREVEPARPENEKKPNRRLDLVVLPQVQVFNDEERKPVSIGEHIGRRPIFAAGNVGTTGDIEMLRWSQSGDRPSLQLLVLHDDAEREMAYGEPGGESLDAAAAYGWQVVRIAKDWKRVFAKPLERNVAVPAPVGAAASPASATPPVAAPAAPAPTLWATELAAFERAERDAPPATGGVVLLGSSNIRLWTTLADDFPDMNVLNRGVSGCLLTELADHAPRLVAAAKPRVIVVAAGTNDVAAGTPAPAIRAAFERLVTGLRGDHPDATIVFLAISPTMKRWEQRDRQAAANAAVKEFIDAAPADAKLAYLDVNAAFLGPDGTPAEECFADDQQHPSTIGNARRAEIMRPVLRDLLGTP
jgi:lysophospholipase L1-like esterase/phosphoserine phosphatase